MQSTVFGIDLGTACSNASYIDATGNVVTARSSEGANTTPSVVYFTDNGDTTVGEVAKDLALVEPDRTAQLVKPLMSTAWRNPPRRSPATSFARSPRTPSKAPAWTSTGSS